MHRRTLVARASFIVVAALASTLVTPLAFGQDKQIKIAHIYSKTGPLEAYGKQTATGFLMGLDYATGGTMVVAAVLIDFVLGVTEITRIRTSAYALKEGLLAEMLAA